MLADNVGISEASYGIFPWNYIDVEMGRRSLLSNISHNEVFFKYMAENCSLEFLTSVEHNPVMLCGFVC